jgi:flagellin-specific chaperone FliS
MIYEHMYQTKIDDFGCIQHPENDFIGASPDGINIDLSNKERFGRMLEIKNIVNREITGIPKEEYWVQTQVQMETCNLDECDFVETRFKESMKATRLLSALNSSLQGDSDLTNDLKVYYQRMTLMISDVNVFNNGILAKELVSSFRSMADFWKEAETLNK